MTNYNFQPKGLKSELGWYFRKLPHFEGGEIPQFLTARLFDSLPQKSIEEWRIKLKKDRSDAAFRKRIEKFLDAGYGECFMSRPEIATVVQNTLLFYNQVKYNLISWVVMPNHIHVLLKPYEGVKLSDITQSIKSYTAHRANRILNRNGRFWQAETFDRYIRNRKHFLSVIKYIEDNPVKAKLCENKNDWKFGSAFYRADNIEY
ncbi:MAG: transposase [Pyrinomonadaceae bacterium]|nr:transposase [Pyrinomonadaceae bacterium]